MSTKIYNGFRWNIPDMTSALQGALAFQSVAATLAQKHQNKFLAFFDSPIKGLDAWRDRRQAIRQSGLRSPAMDTDFSLVLFPVKGLSVPGCWALCIRSMKRSASIIPSRQP